MTLGKIEAVKVEMARLKKAITEMEEVATLSHGSFWGPKETGAVRRASMDLTRALANMRKTGR